MYEQDVESKTKNKESNGNTEKKDNNNNLAEPVSGKKKIEKTKARLLNKQEMTKIAKYSDEMSQDCKKLINTVETSKDNNIVLMPEETKQQIKNTGSGWKYAGYLVKGAACILGLCSVTYWVYAYVTTIQPNIVTSTPNAHVVSVPATAATASLSQHVATTVASVVNQSSNGVAATTSLGVTKASSCLDVVATITRTSINHVGQDKLVHQIASSVVDNVKDQGQDIATRFVATF